MAIVHKTITLTSEQDQWIQAQVDGGQFIDDSDYIRDLIRRAWERGENADEIRAALMEGETSGEPQSFVMREFLQEMRARHG